MESVRAGAAAQVDAPSGRTVLIYRLGSLGDTIVSLPCFHRIAQSFPDARRIVLTNEPVSKAAPRLSDILENSGLVHGTVEYKVSLRSPAEFGRLWLRLRYLGADTLCYLAAPRGYTRLMRDLAFFRACGIRRVIGAPHTADLQDSRADPASGEQEHECERLARSLAALGPLDLQDPASWDLKLSETERTEADQHLGAFATQVFFAVNMGGKAVENDWGSENWAVLLDELSRANPSLRIVFVGGRADSYRADALASGRAVQFLNLCGALSPRGTAAVLSRARLFIGHDSGPLHLAAACNVPCVGIFSNRHKPRKWHPYGAHHRIIHPADPISTVSVARVGDAVASALAAPRVSWPAPRQSPGPFRSDR